VVVEDVAVLVDLDERRPLVRCGLAEHLRQVSLVDVEGSRDERRARSDCDRERVERVVERAEGRRLRHLAALARRRVLALREPVDLVVEEEDLYRDVAPQGVDEVVAADREGVAVAGHHPHEEVGARRREPGRERGSPAVDAVDAVRVHVVREAARAADPRDKDHLLGRNAELRQEALHRGEDGVVPATGTPARVLIGREVLARELGGRHGLRSSHSRRSISCSMSAAKIGWPCTFE
jgi:hypothetical protein